MEQKNPGEKGLGEGTGSNNRPHGPSVPFLDATLEVDRTSLGFAPLQWDVHLSCLLHISDLTKHFLSLVTSAMFNRLYHCQKPFKYMVVKND